MILTPFAVERAHGCELFVPPRTVLYRNSGARSHSLVRRQLPGACSGRLVSTSRGELETAEAPLVLAVCYRPIHNQPSLHSQTSSGGHRGIRDDRSPSSAPIRNGKSG